VLMYDRSLNEGELSQVHGYLSSIFVFGDDYAMSWHL